MTSWLDRIRPGINRMFQKRESPDNLWIKDPDTGQMLFKADLEAAQWVTPSGKHMRIGAQTRLSYLFDGGTWETIPQPPVAQDPLKFKDDKPYAARLKDARAKNGTEDCMTIGAGQITGHKAVVVVQDFAFMGGSLGMAAGEAFIRGAEEAVARRSGLVCVTAAGGARMQEGILSLMQMPRTTLAIDSLKAAGLPYIVVLTDPTTGGVTASYAMLGDVHLAEPGALIGLAGPRVIEQTIRQTLPEGFQRAEYLRDHGMVDAVVDRRRLRETLGRILGLLMPQTAQ
jgi:acetyl-CoA carboxylase carboxyl transferase subunit beta